MNLRANKSALKREKRKSNEEGNTTLRILTYIAIIISLSFGVFGTTVYLDGQSQTITKQIAINEREIYRLNRESQNIKMALEVKSTRDFVLDKVNQYKLGLRPANPSQIVVVMPNERLDDSNDKQVAMAY